MSDQPAPVLRGLPIELDGLSLALEGGSFLTGGRLHLHTGAVHRVSPLSVHAHP